MQRNRELDPDASFVVAVTLALLCAGAAIFSPQIFQGNWQSFLKLGLPESSSIANGDAGELFKTPDPLKDIGVRSICAAEGNCDSSGNRTALSKGHIDPGNGKYNRGWCSDQGRGRDESEADQKCLEYAQRWLEVNQDAVVHGPEVYVNAIDLANQSSVKEGLADKYQRAKLEGRSGTDAIAHARVESFRRGGELSAGGLFKVCSNPRNQFAQRLRGMVRYSEGWRYHCIRQDQERRVMAIHEVLTK
jgi:D-alanyl-D-alanine dipeptidase